MSWWRYGMSVALLLCSASSAWADSLVVMSGAGQSGLGGSAGARPIVVQVRNVDGGVIAGRTINWTSGNGFVLSAPSSTTDANGLASVNFTYGNYGSATITAADAVGGTTAQAQLTSTGSDSITIVSGDRQVGKTGTSSAQPIVVEIRNAVGNPVVGRTVNWTNLTAYTAVSAPASVTDTSGRASMTFSYLRGPPTLAITGTAAQIRATNSASPSTQFVDASVTVLGVDYLQVLSGSAQSGLINTTSAPIVVRVTDWAGNPLAGATVTWADMSGGRVALSSTSTTTDASGQTSITFQYVFGGLGTINASLANGASEDMTFRSVATGMMTLVSPANVSGAPGSISPSPIVVEWRTPDGQLGIGVTVTWLVLGGDAVLNSTTSVTDASGRTSMGFTYGSVQSRIRAEVATVNFGTYGVASFYPVTPTNTMRLVSGAAQLGTINSPAPQPIVVELLDSAGAPVTGAVVTWTSDPQVTLASSSTLTDASGRSSMSFTFGPAGRWQISAESPTMNLGAGVTARFTAVGIESLTPISGSNQSGLVGTHSAQPMVVELRGGNGQPLVGSTIDWNVNSNNAALDAATSVTDASGRASMGFTYGTVAAIVAIDARHSGGLAAGFVFTAVGANSLSMVSGNGQAGLVDGSGAQPLVVEARDAAGNPVAGRSIGWTNLAGATSAIASSSVTDASGRASMNFIYGPNPSASIVAATDSATGQQVRFTLTSTRPAGSGLIISGNGQSGLPGTAGAQPIVIELRDASGAPLSGAAVAWSVVSGPATLGAVSNTTDASGRASAAFNFGATAGTSVLQASGLGGQLLQVAVTALGNNQALSVVSGDAQTLVANTTSEPLVVLLKNFANVPVAGATINWTTSGGTLASASTVTDATGRASNTVITTVAGAVTVHATSTLAPSSVTFTLNTSLATLPNLTPEQQSVAVALDNACPALADLSTLSPEQADLLARCQEISVAGGINGGATAAALEELLSDSAQAQSATAAVAVSAQVQNVNSRLVTLRSGSGSPASNGLTFTGPGGMIQLGSLISALSGDVDKPKDPAAFSRWGIFATGNIGRGEADATRVSPAYDYDINGITVGVDYRQRDNVVMGAALGYSRQDTDLDDSQGSVAMSGWSLSGYSTYSFKQLWYLDGVLTFGRNRFELTRRIAYTLPTPGGGSTSISQVATGKPDGDLFSAALTFGGDFHKDAWAFSPYGQVVYSRMGFDAYEESLRAGPGSGLGLAVESRDITALTGILGARVMLNHSADWGVFTPTASLEWNHEFKDDPESISARLIYDPTHTLFNISGERMDSDYLRIGIGMSLLLTRGRSGFLLFQHMVARDGQSQDNLSLGIRVEF